MSDLIDRQAAIDECYPVTVDGEVYEVVQVETLMGLPSAQPEIIRCQDCSKREYCRTSTVWAVPPNDDWYCADAERRTDG